MSDINKMISDAIAMRKGVLKSLNDYMMLYHNMDEEIHHRFNEELRRNNSKMAGLEDFHSLTYKCRKNFITIKSACNLLLRMSDLSGFDIQEEDELVKELDKILKE
jgi:hypothetical protein